MNIFDSVLKVIIDIGAAGAVFGVVAKYLLKNFFNSSTEPLTKAMDRLTDKMEFLTIKISKVDEHEQRLNDYGTRIKVLEVLNEDKD